MKAPAQGGAGQRPGPRDLSSARTARPGDGGGLVLPLDVAPDVTIVGEPCIPEDSGVTVVVDFSAAPEAEALVRIGCANGPQESGWAALENAGLSVGSVPGFPGAAVCTIDDIPASGYPDCWYNGFWSYWHAASGWTTDWEFSQLGASLSAPEPGTVEGWSYDPDLATPAPPPVVAPWDLADLLPIEWPYGERADAAAAWLSGEIVDGTMPGFSPGLPDWGLTLDTLWALAAADAEHATADEIAVEVEAHVADFATYDAYDIPGVRVAGAMSKELLTAAILGADPHDFGGYDVRQEVLDMVAGQEAGVEEGRVRDLGTGSDSSNLFAQSLAVLGLSRTGGVPEEVVQFLLRQQCSDGYFRIFYNDQLTCDEAAAAPDRDATALAVQALISARDHGVGNLDDQIDLALDWFEQDQRLDGSFGGGMTTGGSNTNSTGLVAQALKAGGREGAYRDAAAWVSTKQVTEQLATGALVGETGTIAYNADDLQSARDSGISDSARGTWRRSTPQAIFAFVPVPLGELTLDDDETGSDPSPSPDRDPTTDPEPSPDPEPDPSRNPDSSPDPEPTAGPDPATSPDLSASLNIDPDPEADSNFERTSDDYSGRGNDGGPTPSPTSATTVASPAPSASQSPSPATESPGAPEDEELEDDATAVGSPGEPPGGVPPELIAVAAGVLLGAAVIGGRVRRRRRA